MVWEIFDHIKRDRHRPWVCLQYRSDRSLLHQTPESSLRSDPESQILQKLKTDEVRGLYHFDDMHFGRFQKGNLSCCWEVQETKLI